MKKWVLFIGAVAVLLLSSCATRQLHVFMADHGTCEAKSSAVWVDSNHMRELVHFTQSDSAFYFLVDEDPGIMIWYGRTPEGKLGLFWSDLDGDDVNFTAFPRLRRLALDTYADEVVWEEETMAGYVLKVIGYDQIGIGSGRQLPGKSGRNSFGSLVVNPDNSGKIFWVERNGDEARFVEMDMATGKRDIRLSSADNPYVLNFGYMAVDTVRKHVYWSQNLKGGKDDLIGRANYENGTWEPWVWNIQGGAHYVSYPAQISLDQVEKRVFWADINQNWVMSAATDGKSMEERAVRLHVRFPADRSLSEGKCYPQYHPTSLALARVKVLPWCAKGRSIAQRGFEEGFDPFDGNADVVDPVLPDPPGEVVYPPY
jgi:hypothetical protein